MANKKKSKKQSTSTSGHHHGSSSSSVVAASNQNIANVRNIFTQPVNLDSCFLCDDHKPKALSKKTKTKGVIPHTLQDFWLEAPIKKKLQLLQMDCKFVLDQIRCSSPYTTKEGDKPAFLSKPSSCLCPACRKKKAIFNAVIAVFEDYVNELEGKPPSANSASQQVAASFQHSKLKTNTTTTQQQPLAISSECTTTNNSTTPIATSATHPSTTEQQQVSNNNNFQQQATTTALSENDHVLVSKQLSKISEKTQFLIEDEANNNNTNSSTNSTTTETSQTTIATSDNTSPQNEVPLPFGRYLTVKNGKITVTDDYVRKDNCEHFLRVIQKCEEAFPNDLKLGPNEFPVPENIHTLINYCTANSEVNIKKILLKNAKKAFSSNNNNNNNHHHSLTSPQTQNQTNPTNSNVMTSQILNLFQQQQGSATATLTLGSNGTVLNNVNVQMVTDNTKQNSKTTTPTSSQNSSSLSTSHLQVQVPPSVTITATSSTTIQTHNQKSSVMVHSSTSQTSSTAALVVSGSIDMTSTGSGSSQNMKVVNGSIAMVHLGNVKDLIRGGESNTNTTVVLNNLQHEEEDEDDEEEEDDEEVIDDEEEEEEEEEEDGEEGDEEDIESEDDEETDDYSSDSDEEISTDKGSANHSELRSKNRSFDHDDQYYKRRVAKRHSHQKEGDSQKEQDEKNEILASNMRESKLLFQIYLARLFSHNIRVAYNDLCAAEMQKCLLEEFERESEMKATTSKNSNKNKKSTKKNKDKKKEEKPATPAKKTNSTQNKTPEKPIVEVTKDKPSEEVVSPNQSISTNNDYDSEDNQNYEQDYLNAEEQEEDDYYDSLDYDYDDDFENRGAIQDWNVVTKKPKQPKSIPGSLNSGTTTTPRGTTYNNTYSNRGRGGSSVRGGRGGSITSLRPASNSSTNTTTPGTPQKVTTPTPSNITTPPKVATSTNTGGNTPQKPSSYYSISSTSNNQNLKNTPTSSNNSDKQQGSHQFHSQHVKTASASSTTIISPSGSINTSGTPLPVPVPTLQPLPQAQQPQQQPQQAVQTQQGGFILLPSAVNGANSKITKHSRQQSSSSVSSNNTSSGLESPMHSFANQTPSGNSTVSSVVGELLNDDEYLMLSGLKRSTTPSNSGASTSSPNSVGSGSNSLPNPQAFQNQHSLFGGSNTLFDSSFGNIAKNNVSPSNGNINSPRSNSLIYNPFDMGMQYGNPNMMHSPQYNPTLGMGNGLYPGFNLFGPPSNNSFPMPNTIQQAPQQQASNASWSLFQGYGSFSWNPIMGNNSNLSNMNLGGGLSNSTPQQTSPFNGSNNSPSMKNTVPSE